MPTILVVEDDPTIAGLLEHIFTVDGYRVLVTDDAERALALVRTGVDAVLVDRALEVPDERLRRASPNNDLWIEVIDKPLAHERLHEMLHHIHGWVPPPPESAAAR